jgi:hypothetical protein
MLISMTFPGEIIRVIDSFLAYGTFRFKIDGAVSGSRLMSPLLNNLYIWDIPKSIG